MITDEIVRVAGDTLMQHGINAPEQEIYRAARAALSAALAAMPQEPVAWRTMDSAPKDGTRFLARDGDRHFDCWWRDKGYGEAYWTDDADSEPSPDCWTPLPLSASPVQEAPPAVPSEEDDLRAAREAAAQWFRQDGGEFATDLVMRGKLDGSDAVQSALIALRNSRAKGAA